MKLFELFKFLNRCKFKIGDKVICVNDLPLPGNDTMPPVIYKKEYTVNNINQCSCGSWSVDVGLLIVMTPLKSGFTNCECGRDVPGKGIHWCHQIRFEKAKSKPAEKEKESEFKKISFTENEKLTVKILEEKYEIGQN